MILSDMKPFPVLTAGQVAILFADAATGHIVDINFELLIHAGQEPYLICPSLDDAKNKIESLFRETPKWECVIYDSAQKMIKYVSPFSLK